LGRNLKLREKYKEITGENGDIIIWQVQSFQNTVKPKAKN